MKFAKTAAAIALFDASKVDRNVVWDNPTCNEEVLAAEAVDKAALTLVQYAFYLDTAEINRLHDCLRVDMEFMARCVRNEHLKHLPQIGRMPA
jgi:hypothetical protein